MKTVAAHNNVSTLDGFALGSRDGIGIEACSCYWKYRNKRKKGSLTMDFQEINHSLKETRDELLGTLQGLNPNQLNMREDSDRWSIGQICQHLIKTEELFVVAIRKGLKSKEDSSIEEKSLEFFLDRSKKIAAPDIAKPTDEIIEYNEIIEKLKNSREKLYELLNTIEDPSVLSLIRLPTKEH